MWGLESAVSLRRRNRMRRLPQRRRETPYEAFAQRSPNFGMLELPKVRLKPANRKLEMESRPDNSSADFGKLCGE